MKLGVVNEETWRFFGPLYEEFDRHHQTSIYRYEPVDLPFFQSRVNKHRSKRALQAFMKSKDAVFFEWASGLLAQASRLEKTCAIVTRLHRYELYQWADKIDWDNVDRVILVSQAKKREFVREFPGQADKVVVIPEAIDPAQFPVAEKPFAGDLGILCHLSPRKRVYELILTFSALVKAKDNYHLHIGGGPHSRFPEYETILKSLVGRLGLADKVTFYGPVKDAAGWYRNIDIFISNSYSEGLQVSPMEAMASGCYSLSHWWDGADELLPPDQLFFTDEELIGKIDQYAEKSEAAQREIRERLRGRVRRDFNMAEIKKDIRHQVEAAAKEWQEVNR